MNLNFLSHLIQFFVLMGFLSSQVQAQTQEVVEAHQIAGGQTYIGDANVTGKKGMGMFSLWLFVNKPQPPANEKELLGRLGNWDAFRTDAQDGMVGRPRATGVKVKTDDGKVYINVTGAHHGMANAASFSGDNGYKGGVASMLGRMVRGGPDRLELAKDLLEFDQYTAHRQLGGSKTSGRLSKLSVEKVEELAQLAEEGKSGNEDIVKLFENAPINKASVEEEAKKSKEFQVKVTVEKDCTTGNENQNKLCAAKYLGGLGKILLWNDQKGGYNQGESPKEVKELTSWITANCEKNPRHNDCDTKEGVLLGFYKKLPTDFNKTNMGDSALRAWSGHALLNAGLDTEQYENYTDFNIIEFLMKGKCPIQKLDYDGKPKDDTSFVLTPETLKKVTNDNYEDYTYSFKKCLIGSVEGNSVLKDFMGKMKTDEKNTMSGLKDLIAARANYLSKLGEEGTREWCQKSNLEIIGEMTQNLPPEGKLHIVQPRVSEFPKEKGGLKAWSETNKKFLAARKTNMKALTDFLQDGYEQDGKKKDPIRKILKCEEVLSKAPKSETCPVVDTLSDSLGTSLGAVTGATMESLGNKNSLKQLTPEMVEEFQRVCTLVFNNLEKSKKPPQTCSSEYRKGFPHQDFDGGGDGGRDGGSGGFNFGRVIMSH